VNKATVRAKLVFVDGRPVDELRNRMGVSGAVRRIAEWKGVLVGERVLLLVGTSDSSAGTNGLKTCSITSSVH